jgi:hypothetical protein
MIFKLYEYASLVGFPITLAFATANANRWKHITGWTRGWKAGSWRAYEETTADISRLTEALEKCEIFATENYEVAGDACDGRLKSAMEWLQKLTRTTLQNTNGDK